MANDKNSFEWSNQKINKLMKLKAQGMSLTDIGKRFGITRNAVGGKLDRIKHPDRKHRNKPRKTGQRREKVIAYKKPPHNEELPVTPIKPPPNGSLPLQFGSHKECRYPFGDIQDKDLRFCLESVQRGSSYCPEHHTLCHAPTTPYRPNRKDNAL